jgi:hypothetical protein
VNVRILSILLILPLISGCASFSLFDKTPRVEVKTTAVERTKLNLPEPTPLSGRDVRWVVITPNNAEQVWKDLKEKNIDLVLFGLTDVGYEQLSLSMAEIRNFITQQRVIILKYKEYYESEK